jgi:hypothetical protein
VPPGWAGGLVGYRELIDRFFGLYTTPAQDRRGDTTP